MLQQQVVIVGLGLILVVANIQQLIALAGLVIMQELRHRLHHRLHIAGGSPAAFAVIQHHRKYRRQVMVAELSLF